MALQFHGWKPAVRCTEGVALHPSPVPVPVLSWGTGTAGSGQQHAGPCAAAACVVHLYPHRTLVSRQVWEHREGHMRVQKRLFVRPCINFFRQMKQGIQVYCKNSWKSGDLTAVGVHQGAHSVFTKSSWYLAGSESSDRVQPGGIKSKRV